LALPFVASCKWWAGKQPTLRRLVTVFALLCTPAWGDPVQLCNFDGHIYGFLYEKPSWAARKMQARVPFACYANGNAITEYYDKKMTFGPSLGKIEVLQDTVRLNHVLHKGDRFRASADEGEGGCTLKFSDGETELKPNDPRFQGQGTDMDCVWLPGYTDHEESIFRVEEPPGPQHWFHLVDRNGHGIGWYLTGVTADGDPIMKPLRQTAPDSR